MTSGTRQVPATLRDVALRAEVSISTVSYVLNNKKTVKPETLARILRAVKEVGYYPNQAARGLRTRRTSTLGVIVLDLGNEFFTQVVRGIEDAASREGYSILLCNADNDVRRETRHIDTLLSKDIDGLILVGTGNTRHIAERNGRVPLVVVDRMPGDGSSAVTLDNVKGGDIAAGYLAGKGRSRIAFLDGPAAVATFRDRLAGYRKGLARSGLANDPDLVAMCDPTFQGGYAALRRLVASGTGFDAVFGASDMMALGALRALLDMGVNVPSDIAVMGFDDIPVSAAFVPALTTIGQPMFDMGRAAAHILFDTMSDPGKAGVRVVFEPTLVARETA